MASHSKAGIKIWDAKTYKLIKNIFLGSYYEVNNMSFSPNNNLLSVSISSPICNTTTLIRSWHVPSFQPTEMTFPQCDSSVMDISYSPDGKHMAVAYDDNTIQIWKTPEEIDWSVVDNQ